jgi:FtsH-binding integral membrane protein
MSDFNPNIVRNVTPAGVADMSVDVGLRRFMLGVYNKLALGLVVSAALSFLTGSVPAVQVLLFRLTPDGQIQGYTPLGWVVSLAPLGILLMSGFLARNITPRTASLIYWSIVALIGASMGSLLFLYTGVSIFSTFLVTASAFGVLSLIGYTTKKDLTGIGSFLIMGVWGLLIASIVNIWMQSAAIAYIVSGLGVLIFSGLIAYDTQNMKMRYYALGGDEAAMSVATSYGALNLYLDFINLFRFLLMFLGARR